MNFLSRAIVSELLLSSDTSIKRLLVLYPIGFLQQSSLYSATTTTASTFRLKNYQQKSSAKKPKTQQPEQSSLLSVSEIVQKKSVVPVDWTKPSEIPWQAKVANLVNLIGHVQTPVQFQASPDGKYWAGTVIAHKDTNHSDSLPSFRIPIIFEGDLAHIAACHLKEKDLVYIAGQLSADPPPFTFSVGQANVQVLACSINFVQGFSQPKKIFVPCKKEELAINHSATMTKDGDPTLSSWRDLLKNPKQWCDYRENKLNGSVKAKHPDFKHKDSGLALWLNGAPKWVSPGLEALEFDVPFGKKKPVKDDKGDDDWKNLVDNPGSWWDNRSNKINKRSPDFKHKETGKALWLSNSPAWALSVLPPLTANQNGAFGNGKTFPSEAI